MASSMKDAFNISVRNEEIKKSITNSIKSQFPIEGSKKTIELESLQIDDTSLTPDDFPDQKKAKLAGKSWDYPVYATMNLVDNETGNTIDSTKLKIGSIPMMTNRFSTIIDGNEYHTMNQFRLKPGIYTRVKNNGQIVSQFNLEKGFNFEMDLDPEKRIFYLTRKNKHYELYSILRALGIDDNEMRKVWGEDVYKLNVGSSIGKQEKIIIDLYKQLTHQEVPYDKAVEGLKEYFNNTKVSPFTTKITLGESFESVTPKALLATSQKILKVRRGQEEPDQRDSLTFKDLYGVDDLLNAYFEKNTPKIVAKIARSSENKDKLREIISSSDYGDAIKNFFIGPQADLSSTTPQTNPLEMLNEWRKTTIMGTGGIQSRHAITEEARDLHPSHIGFLDPIATPDCTTPDHEVFTKTGWKYIDHINFEDEISCLINNRLEFHKPETITNEHYEGPMYEGITARFSYCVTPNHRMYVKPDDHISKNYFPEYRIETAKDMYGKTRRFKINHLSYEGKEKKFFTLPGTKRNFSLNDWSSLVGWYLSEGHTAYYGYGIFYSQISQCPEASLKKYERILKLLSKMKLRYYTFGTNIIITDKQLGNYFKQFGKSYDKFIPREYFDFPRLARKKLFWSLLQGDGRLCKNHGSNQKVFTSGSTMLAKDFEKLAISLGYGVTHKIYPDNREERYIDIHEIRILQHENIQISGKLEHQKIINYSGTVHCLSIPGGLFLTRRNGGASYWTGNSFKVGITLPLTAEVIKKGKTIFTPLLKNGSKVDEKNLSKAYKDKTAAEVWGIKLGFPDQYKIVNGIIKPKGRLVKGYYKGKQTLFKPSEVEYFLVDPASMYSYTSNLVPFLANTQGNRASMGSRMLTQAVSLVNREKPFVQSHYDEKDTWEDITGSYLQPYAAEAGEITYIDEDYIGLKTNEGKDVKIGLYNYFPLNQNSYLHSKPLVKVGSKVKKGAVLADHNFSRDSVLSVGANVNVAYMPWKGYNFEDGVVATESFAEKFTSSSMVKKSLYQAKNGMTRKSNYRTEFPDKLTPKNFSKLDADGIIKEGEKVEPGDILVSYMEPRDMTTTEMLLKKMSKTSFLPYIDKSLEWPQDKIGVVKYVKKMGRSINIWIVVEHPMVVGDKISGRYGNKGIITKIIPDNDAPHNKDGKRIDLIMSPAGVPGRINPSQLLETAAGKWSEKTGKKYIVKNFSGEDSLTDITNKLKKEKLEINEQLFDGKDGKPFENKIFTGNQYILRLMHDVEKKHKARERGSYDLNLQPAAGKSGGQSFDPMTMYAMIAHGASKNLRDATLIKGQKNDEIWRSLQLGLPLPTPKTNFVFDKLVAHLQNAGVNVDKNGNYLITSPFTDKQLSRITAGEIKDAREVLRGKNLAPIKGGLFDLDVVGGMQGNKWAHINLNTKMPHPMFEDAIIKITGLTRPKFDKIMDETYDEDGITGTKLIQKKLSEINLKSEIRKTKAELKKAPKSKRSSLNKKYKHLDALRTFEIKPSDLMISKFPVMPSKFRPIYPLPSGDLQVSPINHHYRQIAQTAYAIKTNKDLGFDEELSRTARKDMYRVLKEAVGLQEPLHQQMKRSAGIVKTIAGSTPKEGFAQRSVWAKRQDVSGRSTVTVDPSLGLDQAGIPIEMAKVIYRPFIIKEMLQMGFRTVEALENIKNDGIASRKALLKAMEKRPVLLNRAPTLHKHGIQAFKPQLVDGKDIKTNPLINAGFNLDYDGDSVSSIITIGYDFESSKNGGILKEFDFKLDFDQFMCYIIDRNIHINQDQIMIFKNTFLNFKNTKTNSIINRHISEIPYYKDRITKQTDAITEYEVPDFVKVFALENGKQVFKPVARFSIHKNLIMYKVTTGSKREVIASEDHSLICYNPKTGTIEKIKPENSIGLLTPLPKSLKMSKEEKITKIEGWFIGAMVGDGWTNGKNTKLYKRTKNQLMLANSDTDIIKAANDFIGKEGYSLTNTHDFDGHESTSTKTTWANKFWSSYFREEIGEGAKNKHLPRNFLFTSEDYRFGLLSGLIDTDGTVSKVKAKAKNVPQYMCSYTTISEELHYQIQQLAASLGIRTSVTTYMKDNLVYSIYIYMNDLVKIKNKVNLRSNKKANILKEAFVSVDRKDIVPIKFTLAKYIQKNMISYIKHPVLYVQISKAKKTGTLSRTLAIKICDSFRPTNVEFKTWRKEIVRNNDLVWDTIKTIEPSDETIGYDLTVPGPYVFMLSNLMTVQDTMAVHVPVMDDAVDEAWGMLPSKNVFKAGDNSVVHAISKDYQLGLYYLTVPGKESKKRFRTVIEAETAGLGMTDIFSLNGKKTTIGIQLVNSILPKQFRDYDSLFDSIKVNSILEKVAIETPENFDQVISGLKDLGNRYGHIRGSSVSIDDLRIDTSIRDKILKKWESTLGPNSSDKKKIEAYKNAKTELKEKLHQKYSDSNKFYEWLKSGALRKEEGIIQMIGMPGILQDIKGKEIPIPITKSYGEGLDSFDYWNSIYGVRKGTIDRAVNTQESGELNKRLLANTRKLLITEEDCGTNDGVEFYITDKNILDRTSAFELDDIVEAGQLITLDIQQKLKKSRKDTIIVRSPLTCETSEGVCQKCYGLMPGGNFPPIGTNVGVLDGQAISERSTQLTMRTFHTGGVADVGGAVAGFKRLEQIFKVPETVPNKATLAQLDGQIDSIKESPIGGKDILINGINHYIPLNLEPTVKRYQTVTKGQKISTGVIKPQELAELKTFKDAQRGMVQELDNIYENKFFQKTFETAIRGVTDNAEILEPGDTDFLPGDKVAASYIKKKNKALIKDGKTPAQFNEYFKSIEMLTDDGQDWLDRLSNVHLKNTIKDMASTKMASNIHGHNPLPAYMYGLEFSKDPKYTY